LQKKKVALHIASSWQSGHKWVFP